ncbi:MAG: folylpolyglutamate synthase/dihydrofolate synthase family protein [Actinomycetota bacterium]|nr:folylpolyglutamate synthase/dihydrofolate synthase family protein [Actinomycetota bacterium]
MADSIPLIVDRADAEGFLDRRIGQGVKPGLERIAGVLEFMGNPQLDYPVIHVAGTNGKTTVTRLVADILGAHGIRTGTFTSPHLHRLEERFSIDGAPITPEVLIQAVSDIAWFVEEYERRSGTGITYFEVTAALAFSLFAEVALDVAIIEVGMGGRWDATNVVDAAVAVVTGIALDHVEYLGETVTEIATEKAAIVGRGGIAVTGPLPPAAEGAITARVDEMSARWYRSGDAFSIANETRAVGGWMVDVVGIFTDYTDLYLPVHGRHQIDNLATAIATAETFLERALDIDALRDALAATTQPGRIEVVHHHPLVIVDGAHNVQGIEGLASALRDEFPAADWHVVAGMRGERSPGEILEPLTGLAGHLWATAPDDPGAIEASAVALSAAPVLGCEATVVEDVPGAVAEAMSTAGPDGAVVVVGSLYVAGEARESLIGTGFQPSGVHVRFESVVEDDGEDGDDEPWVDTDDAWAETDDDG